MPVPLVRRVLLRVEILGSVSKVAEKYQVFSATQLERLKAPDRLDLMVDFVKLGIKIVER